MKNVIRNLKRKLSDRTGGTTESVVAVVLIAVACFVLSFFMTAGILWVICWAFRLTWWSWRACLGVWLAMLLLSGIFRSSVKVER